LERNTREAVLGGVCAGIEARTGFPGALWRVVFSALALVFGLGVIAYIALWFALPKARP